MVLVRSHPDLRGRWGVAVMAAPLLGAAELARGRVAR